MNLRFTLLAVLICAGCAARARDGAPDPTQSDGDKYQIAFENEHVRVLHYRDVPGAKTHLHHHPNAFVLYALSPFSRTLSFPDGTRKVRSFATGEAAWMPAQTHVGQNDGQTPSDALLVEVKRCVP